MNIPLSRWSCIIYRKRIFLLAEMAVKYHLHLIPVVDTRDVFTGIVRCNDILKRIETRIKI